MEEMNLHSSDLNNSINYGESTTASRDIWSVPFFIKTIDIGDSVEVLYTQQSLFGNKKRVFKIVYSYIDGKMNKSEPIYGKIIEQSEDYKF